MSSPVPPVAFYGPHCLLPQPPSCFVKCARKHTRLPTTTNDISSIPSPSSIAQPIRRLLTGVTAVAAATEEAYQRFGNDANSDTRRSSCVIAVVYILPSSLPAAESRPAKPPGNRYWYKSVVSKQRPRIYEPPVTSTKIPTQTHQTLTNCQTKSQK